MKLVIDTNLLLACFSPKSNTHWLWEAFRLRQFTLCVSTEVLDEYAEIFEQKYSYEAAELVTEIILESPNTELIVEYYHWNLIKEDPDDNKFVDTALMANADYLLTQDRHFNVLKNIEFPKIKILNILEFEGVFKKYQLK
jgi:putative PIN family toxin of toxin-antitoxin system